MGSYSERGYGRGKLFSLLPDFPAKYFFLIIIFRQLPTKKLYSRKTAQSRQGHIVAEFCRKLTEPKKHWSTFCE